MSTKNLARTVIEGGRYTGNKLERRESHRGARARLRPQLALATRDPDLGEEMSFDERQCVRREFSDKLAPAGRWMCKQVGRPWSKVEGELLKLFDTRTIAGRHIVYDHMLPRTNWYGDGSWNVAGTRFIVDAKGILRVAPSSWRVTFNRPTYVPPAEVERARAWASGRTVLTRDGVLYWGEPTDLEAPPEQRRYRQAHRLNEEETLFFDALPTACRELVQHATLRRCMP